MFCNQWGVKRSVTAARGRLAYAEDVATLLDNGGIHSAVWMWRSYRKSSWGFELVHEDESRRETEDVRLMNVLNKVWALAAPAAAAAVAPSAHPTSSSPPPRPLPRAAAVAAAAAAAAADSAAGGGGRAARRAQALHARRRGGRQLLRDTLLRRCRRRRRRRRLRHLLRQIPGARRLPPLGGRLPRRMGVLL